MAVLRQSTGSLAGKALLSRSKVRMRRWGWGALRYLVLGLFLVIFLVPFVWMVFWALRSEPEIAQNPFALPTTPRWENLAAAWTTGRYSTYLPNTVIYSISFVIGICFFSCLSGYAVARMRFPGRDLIFIFLLIGIMVPFQSLMIPLYYLARDLHILGTRWGLIIPGVSLGLPFGTFLMRAFFRGLPEELADAARIDGCNEWSVFWRVMLPLAGPGLTTLAVFEFMWSWNIFLPALVLVQRDELRPVALALLFFQDRYSMDRGMITAGVMLTILPVVLVYIFLQRKFIEGITAGALK